MEKTIDKYSFDLTTIYKNNDLVYEDIILIKDLIKKLASYKNNLTQTSSNLLEFFELQDELERKISKTYSYSHLHADVDPNNQTYQTMMSSIISVVEIANNELSFVKNELCDNEKTVREFIKEEQLQNYRYSIEKILRYTPHILDQEKEELISKFDSISSLSYIVYNALRLEFPPVEVNGKKQELNTATLFEFLKNPNPEIRKNAYHNFYNEYKKYENVFSNTLSGVMKKDEFYAEIRNFNSGLEASLFDDEVPTELFDKVLTHANKTYRPFFHKYMSLKKDILKLEPFYNYDINIPLVKSVNFKFNVEEAYQIIKEALKPLGVDYVNGIQKAVDERWVDYYPKPGKRSGAYSGGCYDTKPFILMNYIGEYDSVSTLAHELGHSMHSYLSNQNQTPNNASYRIFVAEVASTVNEVLLIRHMIDKTESKAEKAYFLYEHLENCVGLLYRQPMFADFEHKLHTMAKNKEAMSSKVITDLYYQMSKEYLGNDVTLDELAGISCYYVPHFYYNYYVYKYTIGMTIALALVKRILKNNDDTLDKYLKFLSSGGSSSPIELLSIANVNPMDDQIYHDAFNYFNEVLEEFESIMK